MRQILKQAGDAGGRGADECEGDFAANGEGERSEGGEFAVGEGGVGVAAVFRLDGPEFAGVSAGDDVDAFVARREIEPGADVGGDFVVKPDVGELRAIDGIRAEMVADDVFEGGAAFEIGAAGERGGALRPVGDAVEEAGRVHRSAGDAGDGGGSRKLGDGEVKRLRVSLGRGRP